MPCARQQHRAVRENLAAKEIVGQLIETALDLSHGRLPGEHRLAGPTPNLDRPISIRGPRILGRRATRHGPSAHERA